jgi:hypothetical protein
MVMHAVRQKIKGGQQAQETGRTEIRHDEGILCGWIKGRLHDMNDFYKTKQKIICKRGTTLFIIFCMCADFYLLE